MDKIYFTVNGEHYALSGSEVSPETTLNEYLRGHLQLFGTKGMCHEGGCGACVVSVTRTHPLTRDKRVIAVNSCLVHVLSCHEWDIKTIEGVGNRRDGYHDIQRRLAAYNGSQCGYCSPGWVMGMYSLYMGSGGKLTSQQVERSFGGHMCRCTGYRPILDAFKTFATDTELQDVEDLHKLECLNICDKKQKTVEDCEDVDGSWCVIDRNKAETALSLELAPDTRSRWYKAYTVQDVFKILTKEGTNSYRLVAGNTGKGVFPITSEPRILLDISSVGSLQECVRDQNLVLGAGMTLTEVVEQLGRWAEADEEFRYLRHLRDHLLLVAHEAVRNVGTLGGNLALKHAHPAFPSDVFVILETAGATVTILDKSLKKKELQLQEFLKEDLTEKLITNVMLPPRPATCQVRTYKVMVRAQNTHAVVNAGFMLEVEASHRVRDARVVLGAMGESFVRAAGTERALAGRDLRSDDTLRAALAALADELTPHDDPPEPSPLCRRTVALGLLYKAILSLCPKSSLNPRYLCGAEALQRGVSRGEQIYDTDRNLWPLTQPVPKLEALAQCAGEARYACDVPTQPRDVHVALVLADSIGVIQGFDATAALKTPGVIAFFTATDIPGKNTFTPLNVPWQEAEEEILAKERTLYEGQPVALVAAKTRALAERAAELVRVHIASPATAPVLTVQEALKAPDKDRRVRKDVDTKRTDRGSDTKHVIRGSYSVGTQYHYTMEPQSCWASRSTLGVRVRSSTQWIDLVHVAVANALGLQENQVEVEVERVGGAYGGKASRSALVACACALAAYRLDRAASLVLPLHHNMRAIGMRAACEVDYEVGVNEQGVIQYLNVSYYSDCGCSFNDSASSGIAATMSNLYESARWDVSGYSVLTDKPSNTWCRAPSTTEGTAIMEHIMERIAHVTKRDPIEVKLQHIKAEHAAIRDMVTTLKKDCDYEQRKAEVAKYNEANAWKKRGLEMAIMSYPIEYFGNFPVTVSVYHGDGSVLAAHGGVEMGQGINTKVAQVIAHSLGVPLGEVLVRGSDSFTSPNAMASNGSVTSECVAHAALQACRRLLQRLPPAAPGAAWRDRVKLAYDQGVDLQESYMTWAGSELRGYSVYGACALEVELDVLSGERELRRADLIEDTGRSMSPDIDVGQIEGAFVMGLGLWGYERVQHAASGRLLTARTWSYTPCGARDIPAHMRVSFRRRAQELAPTGTGPGVLRSKATGEPALTLAVVLTHAVRAAARAARSEFGYDDTEWFDIDIPYNVESVLKAISPKKESFKLK